MPRRFRIPALVLAAVVATVVALLPPAARRTGPPPASTVRGAFHIHSNRSDGSGSVDEIAAAAGARRAAVHHPDRPRRRNARTRPAGISQRRADDRRRRAQHDRRSLRRVRPAGLALSNCRHAGGCDRRCSPARRIRIRRAPRFAAAVSQLAGLAVADRWPRVDQRRQRVARRTAAADRAGARHLPVSCPGIDGEAARSSRRRSASMG